MDAMVLRAHEDGWLLCPFCGGDYTHVSLVKVGARREDEAPYLITVETVTGAVDEMPAFGEPLSSRRGWVELTVDCEGCAGGSLLLAQHKGQTLLETHPAPGDSRR